MQNIVRGSEMITSNCLYLKVKLEAFEGSMRKSYWPSVTKNDAILYCGVLC